MIERAHLKILQMLNEEGTLAGAAQRLCLTQSALTHAIKKLESEFNVQLWRKHGRTLVFTPEGEYLLQVAENILPQLMAAEANLKAMSKGATGCLRIGMECHPCYEWLLSFLKDYLKAWPGVELDVVQRFQFNGLDALENHKLDILITSDPYIKTSFANIAAFEYELKLLVSEQHELAENNVVLPEALQHETLISFPVRRERLDVFTYFLAPANIEPKRLQKIEAPELMLELVEAGRGVCTLPDWLAEHYQETYKIRALSLGKKQVRKTLYLVLREAEQQTPYVQGFIDTALASVS